MKLLNFVVDQAFSVKPLEFMLLKQHKRRVFVMNYKWNPNNNMT